MRREMQRTARRILTAKDRMVDPHVPPATAAKLRTVVLDELNRFRAVATHIAESVADGDDINELVLPFIAETAVGRG